MKKSFLGFVLVAMIAVVSWGCSGKGGDSNTTTTSTSGDHSDHDHAGHDHAAGHDDDSTTTLITATILCGKCGEAKGTAACCADGETCASCGLAKGSALCCVDLPEDAKGKDICSACGHVAAADHKCDGDCEKCSKCGLHAGAPACCKLAG